MKTKPVKAWIATDIGLRTPDFACLFFGDKPEMRSKSYWCNKTSGGRNPIPNILRQKPGEITRVTITKETA